VQRSAEGIVGEDESPKARTIGVVSRRRDLMNDKRQKSQVDLAFMVRRKGETRTSPARDRIVHRKRGTE